MKWILLLLIFHGSGGPAVIQEEFTLLSDCLAAQQMVVNSIPHSTNAFVAGGCAQKMVIK